MFDRPSSTPSPIQLVLSRVYLKYDQEFHAHFANPINEIIYDHIHTPLQTLARDLPFLEEEEWLCWMMAEGEGFAVLTNSADIFESKNECGTFPFTLHSKARDILELRKRRIAKLRETRSSMRDTCQEQPQKTVVFLGETFQNFSPSKMESSEPSSLQIGSLCDTYNEQNSAESLILRFSASFEKPKSEPGLKQIVQATLQHLILDFQWKNGSNNSKKGRISGDSSTSEAMDSVQSMESSIETIVREQLEKYKIGHLYGMASMGSQRSHRSIRDKAQQYLRSIRRDWLQ